MKGFYIYEAESRIGTEVDCLKIGYIDHTFTHQIDSGTLSEEVKMHALVSKGTKTKCSPDNTYDFETGALIALMKMCGSDKVKKAAKETFFDVAENSVNEYEEEIHGLKEEIKRLKGESEKRWKIYQRNVQKKQDRINELEAQVKASEDNNQKNIEYYEKENKRLRGIFDLYEKENKELKGNIDELFESEQHTKSELGRLYFEKHRLEEENEKLKDEVRLKKDAINEWKQTLRERNEKIGDLVCENYKLKTDCEKLQHGYNDMMFCGGRQNGKQYIEDQKSTGRKIVNWEDVREK